MRPPRIALLAVVALCGALTLTACAGADAAPPAAAPAAPGLHVDGVELVNQAGQRVVLTGATDYLLPFYLGAKGRADKELKAVTADDYARRDAEFAQMHADGFNTVRVPVAVSTFTHDVYGLGGQAGYLARMRAIVTSAEAAHLNVIFCWWDLLPSASSPAALTTALPTVTTMAKAVVSSSDVLFEPANEPTGISWDVWQQSMQKIMKTFRVGVGYTRPLVIDTIAFSWAFDPTQARALQAAAATIDPAHDQIVFANHRYANDNTCFCGTEEAGWQATVGTYASSFPMLGTEYGYFDHQGSPSPQWDDQIFDHLAGESVPQGWNGALAFVWHWIDLNSMTTDGLALDDFGASYQQEFVERVTQ